MISSWIAYYREELRNLSLDLLFKSIGYLSGHSFVNVHEDTAELVQDRRGLKITFVFGGQQHSIILPYNPYKINCTEYIVFEDHEDHRHMHLHSTIPGLDDILFTKENLSKIYGCNIEQIVSNTDED
jgi:hypothetical protein